MRELLKTYQETIDAIFSKFGIENGYGEIDIKTDVKWTLNGDEEIRWIENDDLYCNEIRRGEPMYYENWMMVYVDNGCGDQFYQIFDTDLRDDSIEE
jgi:hypothetical protein